MTPVIYSNITKIEPIRNNRGRNPYYHYPQYPYDTPIRYTLTCHNRHFVLHFGSWLYPADGTILKHGFVSASEYSKIRLTRKLRVYWHVNGRCWDFVAYTGYDYKTRLVDSVWESAANDARRVEAVIVYNKLTDSWEGEYIA